MIEASPKSSQLVSALVTTFNHERYIDAAIEGLLAQSYDNIEIIVVDDGSADATVERLKTYENRGVRIFNTPRYGPSGAMNVAMSHAAGDIFMIQSGDDLSEPERAERQAAALKDVEVVGCLPRLIDDDGRLLPDDRFPAFYRLTSSPAREKLFDRLYQEGNFLCASSVAMRRSVWQTLGGFHEGLLQLQDYDYWLRVLAAGYSISLGSERLISYRLHATNLSHLRHDVRTQRELAMLLRHMAPQLPADLMAAVVYRGSLAGRTWTETESEVLCALFFLRHPTERIRQIGADILIHLMNHPRSSGEDWAGFGLDRQSVFRALLHA